MLKKKRKVTSVYFVRHAQPVYHIEDRIRPLTDEGKRDSQEVVRVMQGIDIDYVISSPYKRCIDTIAAYALGKGLTIYTDERFRERESGGGGHTKEMIRKRWDDFGFHEDGGESLQSVQARNMEALHALLDEHTGENILLGTHGTAFSTIQNYYDQSCHCDSFFKIIDFMPYIVRMDFDGRECVGKEELLIIEKEYKE